MDSFEWNKIAGAVLGTLIFVMVVKIASDTIYDVKEPAKPGYVVEGVVETTAGGAPAAPVEEALPDFGTVLAKADLAKGKDVSTRCEQCHNLNKGGGTKIGPDLYGVVGRARGSVAGFNYSTAMSSKHDPWTFEALYRYLKSPQSVVPGTKMSFAGLRSSDDRINLIAYLRTVSDSPVAIPPPNPNAGKPAAPAPGAAPANGAAPAGTAPANGAAPAANGPTAPANGAKPAAPANVQPPPQQIQQTPKKPG
ncbi:MAG TPA: cytochrome c family protein [Rhizomicrobium sp.]|jgi:cytochrome c|nr:cytochrome c family protein [Rhizomicrobium sp.]